MTEGSHEEKRKNTCKILVGYLILFIFFAILGPIIWGRYSELPSLGYPIILLVKSSIFLIACYFIVYFLDKSINWISPGGYNFSKTIASIFIKVKNGDGEDILSTGENVLRIILVISLFTIIPFQIDKINSLLALSPKEKTRIHLKKTNDRVNRSKYRKIIIFRFSHDELNFTDFFEKRIKFILEDMELADSFDLYQIPVNGELIEKENGRIPIAEIQKINYNICIWGSLYSNFDHVVVRLQKAHSTDKGKISPIPPGRYSCNIEKDKTFLVPTIYFLRIKRYILSSIILSVVEQEKEKLIQEVRRITSIIDSIKEDIIQDPHIQVSKETTSYLEVINIENKFFYGYTFYISANYNKALEHFKDIYDIVKDRNKNSWDQIEIYSYYYLGMIKIRDPNEKKEGINILNNILNNFQSKLDDEFTSLIKDQIEKSKE